MDRRKALLIGLVVLLVLAGVPLLIPGTSRTLCHDVGAVADGGQACSMTAVLIATAGFALITSLVSRARRTRVVALMRAFDLERPPRTEPRAS